MVTVVVVAAIVETVPVVISEVVPDGTVTVVVADGRVKEVVVVVRSLIYFVLIINRRVISASGGDVIDGVSGKILDSPNNINRSLTAGRKQIRQTDKFFIERFLFMRFTKKVVTRKLYCFDEVDTSLGTDGKC